MLLANHHLQRMHWAIFSPSLLDYPYTVNYIRDEQHREEILQLLERLDARPSEVDPYFEALGRIPMGRYFEHLIYFILERDDRYEILLKNHQVMEEKKTIGELDVVVRDTKTGKIDHWEIALKFYLQRLDNADHVSMVGPNLNDNLQLKMDKLTQHQLPLSKNPSFAPFFDSQHIDSKLFIKGQFFYHLNLSNKPPLHANPQHEKGWWCTLDELKPLLKPELKWTTVDKPQWIGKIRASDNSDLLPPNDFSESCFILISKLQNALFYALE